jgi:hypothetical protein
MSSDRYAPRLAGFMFLFLIATVGVRVVASHGLRWG